jgi:hypothetical protein
MTEIERPRFGVADVFRLFGPEYRARHRLPADHLKAMRNIEQCRTAALGGHLEECDRCGYEHPFYNSCGDKHCPGCQTMAKEKWIEARKADLLPVPYFHQVFTLPHELNRLILSNKKTMLAILFKSVAETLKDFGADPKQRLGGEVGFTLVLHTWNQRIFDHFHLHGIIPAGALKADGSWVGAKHDKYLFPGKAISLAFRGKFIAFLRRAYNNNELSFIGHCAELAHPIRFEGFLDDLCGKRWRVYAKRAFQGPSAVLDYLGRYTHRVAISNYRILDVTKEGVAFSYRDRSDNNKEKVETVSGKEFIRRFLLHIVPYGFMRIRHYGFLANCKKKENLEKCRRALNADAPAVDPNPPKTAPERLLKLTGIDVLECPRCRKGRMRITKELPKIKTTTAGIPQPAYLNSS